MDERRGIVDDAIDGHAIDGDGIDGDALVSRLRLIEDQPLESRADSFSRVHDALRSALEGGDSRVDR